MAKRKQVVGALRRALILSLALFTLTAGLSLGALWYYDGTIRRTMSRFLEESDRIARVHELLLDVAEISRTGKPGKAEAERLRAETRMVSELLSAGDPAAADRLSAEAHKIARAESPKEMLDGVDALETAAVAQLTAGVKSAGRTVSEVFAANRTVLPAVTAAILCGWFGSILAVLYALRGIRKPMDDLLLYMDTVAERDLTADIPPHSAGEFGEVAGAAARLNETLAETIRALDRASEELLRRGEDLTEGANRARRQAELQLTLSGGGSRTAQEISTELTPLVALSQDLRTEAEHAATNVQQIVAMMDQTRTRMEGLSAQSAAASASLAEREAAALRIADLAARVGTAARTAETSTQKIAEAGGLLRREAAEGKAMTQGVAAEAAEGTRAMEEAIRAMARIRESVDLSMASFKSLDAELVRIDRVTQVIEDIAGRTNLLSLNAAIIASQAGEQGHAFGVVAGEIRALAEKTALSTKEIQAIVKDVAKGGRVASEVIENGVARVAEGEKEVRRTGELLERIDSRAREADGRLQRIDAAASVQAEEAAKVAGEISQVSQGMAEIVAEVGEHGSRVGEIRRNFADVEEAAGQTLDAVEEQVRGTSLIIGTIESVRNASEGMKRSIGEVDALLRKLRSDMEIMDLGAREELERTQRLEKDGFEVVGLSGRIRSEIGAFRLPAAD